MAYQPQVRGTVDAANSSVVTLTASPSGGDTFTGAFTDIQLYDGISVIVEGASAGVADGILHMQFSQDGASIDRDIVIAVADVSATPPRTLGTVAQFFRVVYENGTTAQTSFDIQTMYHPGFVTLVSRLDQTIGANEDVTNVRSAIVAQNDAGNWANIKADNDQHLKVNVSNPKTSFDELPIAELTPVAQLTYAYLINTDMNILTLSGSATIVQANNMAVLETTATNPSQAILQSKKFIPFRAGQGMLGRFSAVFTAGVAVVDSRQWVGVGDADNGFLFGYDEENFAVTYRTNGTATVINQVNWSVDVMDGTGSASNPSGVLLDPTKGNLYQVSYGSGFGAVNFSIESDLTGDMVLAHVLEYPNTALVPSTYNPTFPMCAEAHNGISGSNNIILSVASMSGFIEGQNLPTGPQNAVEDILSATTTEAPIFSLLGRTSFGSGSSKVDALLSYISLNNDVNGAAIIRMWLSTGFSVDPTYDNVGADTSVIDTTTLGGTNGTMTLPPTGKLVWAANVGKDQHSNISLTDLNLRIQPGDTITVTCEMISGSGSVSAALVWIEDF